jgi:hypothetical protein
MPISAWQRGDEPGTLSETIKNLCHWKNDQKKKGQDPESFLHG